MQVYVPVRSDLLWTGVALLAVAAALTVAWLDDEDRSLQIGVVAVIAVVLCWPWTYVLSGGLREPPSVEGHLRPRLTPWAAVMVGLRTLLLVGWAVVSRVAFGRGIVLGALAGLGLANLVLRSRLRDGRLAIPERRFWGRPVLVTSAAEA